MGVTREMLYEEVWAEPITKVAQRHGVSGSFLARICQRLAVPRPSRGYWARLAAGLSPAKPALPAVRGGVAEWTPGTLPAPVVPAADGIPRRRRARRFGPRPERHPLVAGVKEFFEKSYTPGDAGHLRPLKRKLPDLFVTPATLLRAIQLASDLYLSFEDRGHSVQLSENGRHVRHDVDPGVIEPSERTYEQSYYRGWRPSAPTVVIVDGVAIGLTLFELSEKRQARWMNGKYVPVEDLSVSRNRYHSHGSDFSFPHHFATGRLVLRAFSAHGGSKWVHSWTEARPGDLSQQLKQIALKLESASPRIAQEVAEAQLRADEERRRWDAQREEERRQMKLQREKERRQAEERRRAQAFKRSRDELLQLVDEWALANRVEAFFAEAIKISADAPLDQRAQLSARLERARSLLGGTDPLARFGGWKSPEERLETDEGAGTSS